MLSLFWELEFLCSDNIGVCRDLEVRSQTCLCSLSWDRDQSRDHKKQRWTQCRGKLSVWAFDKRVQRAALPAAGMEWAWQCLCPHGLYLCSLALFWDPPTRAVMKYVYSLHCSCGVLVTLTHLFCVCWFTQNPMCLFSSGLTGQPMFLTASLHRLGQKDLTQKLVQEQSACCSSSVPSTLPAWELPTSQMGIKQTSSS